MWISKQRYEERLLAKEYEKSRAIALQARLDEVSKARDFAVTSFEWMKTQLSQLSWERNKLLEQVTGVPARKLEFQSTDEQSPSGRSLPTSTPLGDGNTFTPSTSFMDIGDVEAKKAGIELRPALEEIEQFAAKE